MTKKMILLNASPRKNKNTAQMLESVMKGAQEAGAEVELVNLYDRYDAATFSEAHKAEVRDNQFPIDLEIAYELGKRLVGKCDKTERFK